MVLLKSELELEQEMMDTSNVEFLDSYLKTFIDQFLFKYSKQTQRNYHNDILKLIKDFFDLNDYKYITKKHLESITLDDFIQYRKELSEELDEEGERKYTNSTLNRRFSCYKALYEYLEARDKIEYSITKMKSLLKNLSNDSVSIDVLSTEDAERCLEFFKSRANGIEIYLIAKISMYTGLRAEEILTLQWNQIYPEDEHVTLKSKGSIKGKGNKDWEKEISYGLYYEILTLKKEENKKVFNITYSFIAKVMNEAVKELGLDDKDYSFHSFRKCAATNVYKLTNSILAVKEFLNHKNVNTSQRYVKDDKNDLLTMYSTGNNIDKDLYKKVDKEILLEVIEELNISHLLNIKLSDKLKKS